MTENPAQKDPAEWTTGDEPMTAAQESYLTTLAHEAGDVARAGAAIRTSRQAMASVQRYYGAAATGRAEMTAWETRLTDLDDAAMGGPLSGARVKTMYAASYNLSRSRFPRRTTAEITGPSVVTRTAPGIRKSGGGADPSKITCTRLAVD